MATAASKGIKEFVFEWEGKDRNGKIVRGETRAGGINQVQAMLRRQGVLPSKIKKRRTRGGKKIKPKDIALFTRQMATMMKAGVPLLQAFDIVGRGNTNPSVTRLLADIRSDVETGTSLNAAYRKHPLYFDSLYCNLVEAGEAAGILEALLDRLATYMEKTEAIKSKIKSALMYPISVVVVAFIVVTIIMLFVIPAFKDVFSSFGADLPAPTLFVMGVSDIFVQWWWVIFGVIGGGFYFFMQAWKRNERMQQFMDRAMLKMPVFGALIEKSCVARWTRTLSTMFAAGVPLVEALDSVGGASGNAIYANATEKIQQEVSTGTSLTVAMTNANVFPSMVLQMCAIGEESGSIDHMLGKAADFYEEEVDDMVAGLSSLMEPIIIVFLGTLIGGIVVSMYLPIFKLGQVVLMVLELWMQATLGGLLGLLVGSFLNVVVHRLPRMMEQQWNAECAQWAQEQSGATPPSAAPDPAEPPLSLSRPRSRCPHCGHAIHWYENIPVLSYLALRGRCSECKASISIRYPLVELACAALFAYCTMQWGITPTGAAWCLFSAALLSLALIDWDTTLLPDDITLPLLWAGLLSSALHWTAVTLADAVWGAAVGYLSLWLVYWAFKLATGKEGMGYGDFKLFAALGAWFGWQALVPIILISSVIGAVVGIALKINSRLREGGYVPFGPFLAGAGFAAMVFGPQQMLQSLLAAIGL